MNVSRLAIGACTCPACGAVHRHIASGPLGTGLVQAMLAAPRTVGMIAVCSECGAFLWFDGAAAGVCDEDTLARIVPPPMLVRIRELAANVRRRRAN